MTLGVPGLYCIRDESNLHAFCLCMFAKSTIKYIYCKLSYIRARSGVEGEGRGGKRYQCLCFPFFLSPFILHLFTFFLAYTWTNIRPLGDPNHMYLFVVICDFFLLESLWQIIHGTSHENGPNISELSNCLKISTKCKMWKGHFLNYFQILPTTSYGVKNKKCKIQPTSRSTVASQIVVYNALYFPIYSIRCLILIVIVCL